MKKSFCLTGIVFIAIIALTFSGCTSVKEKPEVKEKAGFQINITNLPDFKWPAGLEKEYKKYWTLRYTDQFESAYAMEAPQFREAVNFDQYKNYVARTSNQKLVEIELTQMETYDSFDGGKIADVGTRFHLERKKDRIIQKYIEDKWIRIDKQWFHGMRNRLLFPDVKYE